LAEHERGDEQYDAQGGGLECATGANVAQVHAHEQGNGNGHGDQECAPRAALQRIGDHKCQNGQHNHGHHQRANEGKPPSHAPYLISSNLTQTSAITSRTGKEDDKVLHGTGQDGAQNDPQCTRKPTHLRR